MHVEIRDCYCMSSISPILCSETGCVSSLCQCSALRTTQSRTGAQQGWFTTDEGWTHGAVSPGEQSSGKHRVENLVGPSVCAAVTM